jgi:hypothetical protein
LKPYHYYVYHKYLKIFNEVHATPGFELITILIMLAILLVILKRRK